MKKFLKILVDVVLWGLLIFALFITIAVFSAEKNNGVSNLFGFMPMSVESPSMSPTFEMGDLIIVKEVDDLYKLKKGDVITFYTIIEGKRRLNTHRIIEVNEVGSSISFTTKGDANQIEDSLQVYSSDIVGIWTGTRLKSCGKAIDYLKTKKGFFICIIVPMAIFFLVELYKFIVALIEFKKPAISDEEEEEIKKRAVEEYLKGLKKEEQAGSGEAAASQTEKETEPASTGETMTETQTDIKSES